MNKFIEDLITIGLTPNQAKAYFFLLTNPDITASQLAKISRIPRARVYDVLESLIKKGLCAEKIDKVKHFRSIRPAEALGIIDQELLTKRETLIRLSDTLDKLFLLENQQEDPLDFIEVITDRIKQKQRISFLDELIRFELFAMCKSPYDREFLEDPDFIVKQFSDKDVKYRFLFEMKKNDERKLKPLLRKLSDTGADVRVSSFLPFKMNIFDSRKISFYKVESAIEKDQPILMIMTDNTLVKLFKSVFNKYYEEAE